MAKPNGKFSKKAPWPTPGQRYGYLTVTSRGFNDKHGHQRFWCRCDCGKMRLIRGDFLQNGRVISCGHVKDGKAILKDVMGYRCLETGAVFPSAPDAIVGVGEEKCRENYGKIRAAASPKYPDATFGIHPETGEPLHWERVQTKTKVLKKNKIRNWKVLEKKVILLNTLEVFHSLKDAAYKYPQSDISAISRCCNNERNFAGKDENGEPLVWMWYDQWSMEFK